MRQLALSKLDRALDSATGALLFFSLVFSPWAFGTTELWSIRLMNRMGWVLGLVAVAHWMTKTVGTQRARPGRENKSPGNPLLVGFLAALSLLLLFWSLTSAWNAAAVYSAQSLQFEYRDFIPWLPHSYDARSSWQACENLSALACYFWVLRTWLIERSSQAVSAAGRSTRVLPRRLKTLLWVLSINGGLLALEGLLQRLSGSSRLLWMVQPSVNPGVESQFGPYAYRSNAAQYFNLLWPVTLGFWFVLFAWERHPNRRPAVHHLLLSCVMLMAACPVISDSRAGAVITIGLLGGSGLLCFAAFRGQSWLVRGAIAGFTLLTLLLALNAGGEKLRKRMTHLEVDYEGREEIYRTARKMASEYPWFGTGPGTFDPLFQMYRRSPDQYWPAQLHNDWLETRITFGRAGMAFIVTALACCALRWFVPGAIRTPWIFPAFLWLAQLGCLLHARVDFPLQVYSIVLLFLVECSILFSISRKSAGLAGAGAR